jgi:hypothetical protein
MIDQSKLVILTIIVFYVYLFIGPNSLSCSLKGNKKKKRGIFLNKKSVVQLRVTNKKNPKNNKSINKDIVVKHVTEINNIKHR